MTVENICTKADMFSSRCTVYFFCFNKKLNNRMFKYI